MLGSTFEALADGTRFLFPVWDAVEIIAGEVRLEGNPVTPDIQVQINRTYTQGHDDLIQAGLKYGA